MSSGEGERQHIAEAGRELADQIVIPVQTMERYANALWAGVEGEIRREVALEVALYIESEEHAELVRRSRENAEELCKVTDRLRRELVLAEVTRRMAKMNRTPVGRAQRRRMEKKKARADRQSAQMCVRCPKGNIRPAREGRTTCAECAAKDAARSARYRAAKAAQGQTATRRAERALEATRQ